MSARQNSFHRRWSSRSPTMGNWPVAIKPTLMRLPWPVWKRVVYPLWRRWYIAWGDLPLWREGLYDLGDAVYWRGVRLVCCTKHFAGHMADHPWDPGAGWPPERANALWEPATRRDRRLLRLVGDPRREEGLIAA